MMMQGELQLAHGIVVSDTSYLTNLNCLGILLEVLTRQYQTNEVRGMARKQALSLQFFWHVKDIPLIGTI